MNSTKDGITKIKERLQFVIVLSLFFPTFLDVVFKQASNEVSKSNSALISWGAVIVLLILNYLFIEIMGDKEKLQRRVVKIIDVLLLVNIAMFVPVLLIFVEVQYKVLPALYVFPFKAGILGIMAAPFLIFATLFINFLILWIKEMIREVREIVKILKDRLAK